jgi:hypothetical protein
MNIDCFENLYYVFAISHFKDLGTIVTTQSLLRSMDYTR